MIGLIMGLSPFRKLAFAGLAVGAIAALVGLHLWQDSRVETKLEVALIENGILKEENRQFAIQVTEYEKRLARSNADKRKQVDEANARTALAREEAAEARRQRDIVTEQVALAPFTLIEETQDEQTGLLDWLDDCGPVPAAAWHRLFRAHTGYRSD